MEIEFIGLIAGLSFIYGVIHAFDADHIMAVTSLSGAKQKSSSIRLCLSWALGHGAIMLLAGICVYVFGAVIPPAFSRVAEYLVGILLILIGVSIVYSIVSSRLQLSIHKHYGMRRHIHWHFRPETNYDKIACNSRHDHRAIFVGTVHGAAGVVPLLSVLPVAQSQSVGVLLVYILVFVLGILFAMLMFGGVLGYLIKQLADHSRRAMHYLRLSAASGSVAMGVVILNGLITGAS